MVQMEIEILIEKLYSISKFTAAFSYSLAHK